MTDEFVNLHHHDTYSPFDGLGIPLDNVKRVVQLNQAGLAQTNHGNTSGLIDHFKSCKEYNINPIMGCEAYFVQDNLVPERKAYHITLLAKNNNGYSNLMQLITEANLTGFYYKPKIDFRSLFKYQKDLIVLSGCQNSIIYQNFIQGEKEKAETFALSFFEKLDNFFLEIQPHNIENQAKANNLALYLNKKYEIPLVMTVDSHYTSPKEAEAQLYLRAFKIPDSSLESYKGLYLHDRNSVVEFWRSNYKYTKRVQKAVNNTVLINDMCNVDLKAFKDLSRIDWGENSTQRLKSKIIQGLKRRGLENKPNYKARLRQEFDIVKKRGFEDVFLLSEDVVREANKQGIKVGFGRGSGVSSLIAYCLNITQVDPIENNLLFERFMSMDRKGMPDIDIDFDSRYRDKIFKYIETRFKNQQAPISLKGKYQIRNLLNDFYKLLKEKDKELSLSDKNWLTKRVTFLLENGKDVEHDKQIMFNPKYQWMKEFRKLYKNIRYFGTHPSGVAICKDISRYVSLVKRKDSYVTCYDLDDLEYLGILKLDILGLNTLAVTSTVEEETGCEFNKTILEEEEVYVKFSNGETDAIFQFDSKTAQKVLKKIKPSNLLEAVASTSINRPACLKNGMVEDYVNNKAGLIDQSKLWVNYAKETYGCMIYQEQVMEFLIKVGKCDIEFSYKFVKEASKREDVLFSLTPQERESEIFKTFSKKFKENTSLTIKEIEELYFNLMRYLFNKSHALAYTYLSVYQMWQMIKFPLETIWALLVNETNEDKAKLYETLATRKNILIFTPHVNGPAQYKIVWYYGEKIIQKGMSQIKGVGLGTALEIERQRKIKGSDFESELEVIDLLPKRVLRKNVIKALEFWGAFQFDEAKYLERCTKYNADLRNFYYNSNPNSFVKKEEAEKEKPIKSKTLIQTVLNQKGIFQK